MIDDPTTFSLNQLITVSTTSNYAGCGFGSAGAGVLDLGPLVPSPGGAGGYGYGGALGDIIWRWPLKVVVSQIFAGPAGATLAIDLQDSPDNLTYNITQLGTTPMITIATGLGTLGQRIIDAPLPRISGSTNPPIPLGRYLRILYVVTGGPFTAGAINAFLDIPV